MDADYRRNSKRLRDEIAAEGGLQWDGRPEDMVDWEAEARRSTCSRAWRAKWNLRPRGPMWLPQIIRMTWYLQVIGIVLGLHGGIDGDVGGAFFYSRVSCCGVSGTAKELPAKYDFHYPYTLYVYGVNASHIKGCDLPRLDHNNAFWSHSAYCISWNYVKDFTQNLSADRSLYLQLTGLFFMPIGAGLADKIGRKPIFFFGFMMGMKGLLCNLIDSTEYMIHRDVQGYLLYASALLSGMASGGGPVSMAMMVDIIPGDMREQGFPILSLFGIPGGIIVFFVGFYLLDLGLTSYVIFWCISFGTDFICMFFLLFFLPESMPDSLKKPLESSDLFPGKYYWQALKIIAKYPLLTGIVPCIMISSFAGSGMGSVSGNQLWLGALKFRLKEGLIPGLIGMICGIPANIIAAIVIPRTGVWPAIFFGNFAGWTIGLGSTVWPIWWMNEHNCFYGADCGNGDYGTTLFWAKWGGSIGGTVLGTFVGAISGPATTAMISMQVKQTEQASVQAAFNLVGGLASMGAPWYFTHYYYNSAFKGWKVISYAFFGYSLTLVSSFLFVGVYFIDVYLRNTRRTRTIMAKGTPLDQERLEKMGIPVPKRGSSQSRVGRRGGNSNQPYGSTSSERQPLLNQQGSDNGYNTQYSQL